jgi:hypothetical protein
MEIDMKVLEDHKKEVIDTFEQDWKLITDGVPGELKKDINGENLEMLRELALCFYKRGWEQAYRKVATQMMMQHIMGEVPENLN